MTDTVHTTMTSLPKGWFVEVKFDGRWSYLILHGPAHEGAAFECATGGVRGEILRRLAEAHKSDETATGENHGHV